MSETAIRHCHCRHNGIPTIWHGCSGVLRLQQCSHHHIEQPSGLVATQYHGSHQHTKFVSQPRHRSSRAHRYFIISRHVTHYRLHASIIKHIISHQHVLWHEITHACIAFARMPEYISTMAEHVPNGIQHVITASSHQCTLHRRQHIINSAYQRYMFSFISYHVHSVNSWHHHFAYISTRITTSRRQTMAFQSSHISHERYRFIKTAPFRDPAVSTPQTMNNVFSPFN